MFSRPYFNPKYHKDLNEYAAIIEPLNQGGGLVKSYKSKEAAIQAAKHYTEMRILGRVFAVRIVRDEQ